MKVQQTIKKVGAVAASTLMVGMTMGAAQSLSDFPGMFTDDDGTPTAEIVVGSEGQVADVVGAVNVAAALGQETIQTEEMEETVEGATTTSVDGEEYSTRLGQTLGTHNSESFSYTLDKSDYSELRRETIQVDGEDTRVVEQISVNNAQVDTSMTSATGDDYYDAGQVVTNINSDDVIDYTVDFTPGIPEGESLSMLGEDYTLTEVVSDTEVELGSEMTHSDLEVGDTLEQGPFTVEITGFDSDDNQVRVAVSEDGERLDSATLQDGDEATFGDDDEFTVRADSVFFGDTTTDVILDTVYSEQSLEVDEDFPWDDRYHVESISTNDAGDAVQSVELHSHIQTNMLADDESESDLGEDEILPLLPGDSVSGPSDYFELTFQELTSESMEEMTFSSDQEVTFQDTQDFEQTVDMDEDVSNGIGITSSDEDHYVGVGDGESTENFYPVQITGTSGSDNAGDFNVTLSYESFEDTFSAYADDATMVDFASGDTYTDADGGTAHFDTATGQVAYHTVSTGYGFDITVEWVSASGSDVSDGSLQAVNIYGSDYTDASAGGDNSGEEAMAQFSTLYDAVLSQQDTPDATPSNTFTSADAVDVSVSSAFDSGDNENVEVIYDTSDGDDVDAGEIGEIAYKTTQGETVGATSSLTDYEDGAETLSAFGTHLTLDGTDGATVMLPEEQRYAEHSLGSMTESAGEDQTVEYEGVTNPDIRGTLDDMSMLDSEVTQSVRDSSDLILVGGPAVNTLVQDLAEDGDTWTADNWRNNHQDEALVQLVEDAFTDGQHALIVAGYQAQDTRAAANYISNYAEHADELEGETQVTMTRGEYPGQ